MRFHLGPVPEEFTPDDSWRALREPGPIVMQMMALPLGIVALAGIVWCWRQVDLQSSFRLQGHQIVWLLVGFFASFPALIVAHELLHAIVMPQFGCTRATIVGAWPRGLVFYAYHSGPMSRGRYLAVYAMPFLAISVLPLDLAGLGLLSGKWALVAAWFSSFNALVACGDYLGIILLLAQVPRGAVVQNRGWRTYWRPR